MRQIGMTNIDSPKIYLLPGLNASFPIFSRLEPLLPGSQILHYSAPKLNETLRTYSERLARDLPRNCFLVGVSFGDVLAQEIARILQPKGCIIISSISSPSHLPPWFRVGRLFGKRSLSLLLTSAGRVAGIAPNRISTRATVRTREFSGLRGAWQRWAITELLDWKPYSPAFPLLHIHGDADRTFPIRYTRPDVCIRGGAHSLAISHPQQTATAIREFVQAA